MRFRFIHVAIFVEIVQQIFPEMITLLDLPADIFLHIISYLSSVEDKLNFSRVLNLASFLLTSQKCWHTSTVVNGPGVSEDEFDHWMSFLKSHSTFLFYLAINYDYSSNESTFESISEKDSLLSQISLPFLASFQNLRKITLVKVDLTFSDLEDSPKLRFLREFHARGVLIKTKYENALLNFLCSCSDLRSLSFESCCGRCCGRFNSSDNLETIVRSCPLLEVFNICANVDSGSDSLFAALSELRNLTNCSLNVSTKAFSEFPRNGFVSLCTKSKKLTSLSLVNQRTIEKNLLLWLGKLTGLRSLNLLRCEIPASVIAELSHLEHLQGWTYKLMMN